MGTGSSLISESEVLPPPEVLTANGKVRGKRIRIKGFNPCDTFLGIPFAEPPIGDLRFRKPVRHANWKDPKVCRRYRSRPIQADFIWDKMLVKTGTSEDCLYLNVFAPAYEKMKKYPVMFYIHGGGYAMDAAARLPVLGIIKQLVSKGIVVVTTEYRLGFLGFFSTGDDACKGNMGLFDQAMALQWTKDNIHSFGGDPNNITVAGQSAGGTSTDILSLSPITRDLFHKKMVLAGTTYCGWSFSKLQKTIDYCRAKAVRLGWKPNESCSTELEKNNDMMDFLRKVPAQRFAITLIFNEELLKKNLIPVAPVYDGDFIPRKISVLRDEAPKMPSLTGIGEHEALLFAALHLKNPTQKHLENIVREATKDEEIVKAFLDEFPQKYGEWKTKPEFHRLYIDFYSDCMNNHACWRYLKHSQTHSAKTFAYSFDYTHPYRLGTVRHFFPFHGATHTSEVLYLFQVDYFHSFWPWSKTEQKVMKITSEFFTNFVKTGDVNGDNTKDFGHWPEVPKRGKIDLYSIKPVPEMKDWKREPILEILDEFIVEYLWNNEDPVNLGIVSRDAVLDFERLEELEDVVEEAASKNDVKLPLKPLKHKLLRNESRISRILRRSQEEAYLQQKELVPVE